MPSTQWQPEAWVGLLQQALGDKYERADALVVACAVIDGELRRRYPAESFGDRVDGSAVQGPVKSPDRIKRAWQLRNSLAHEALIPPNWDVAAVVLDVAREHLRITGAWTRALDVRLAYIADCASSTIGAASETPVALVDAPHELAVPSVSDKPIERAVALLLAAGLLERHIEERSQFDAHFPSGEPFRARLEYALTSWLGRTLELQEARAVGLRNCYAHEAKRPVEDVEDEVLLLIGLAEEIGQQTDELRRRKDNENARHEQQCRLESIEHQRLERSLRVYGAAGEAGGSLLVLVLVAFAVVGVVGVVGTCGKKVDRAAESPLAAAPVGAQLDSERTPAMTNGLLTVSTYVPRRQPNFEVRIRIGDNKTHTRRCGITTYKRTCTWVFRTGEVKASERIEVVVEEVVCVWGCAEMSAEFVVDPRRRRVTKTSSAKNYTTTMVLALDG